MKLILRSNKLPDDYDKEALAMRIETMLAGGYFVAVYVEERDGAEYEVKVTLSDADTVSAYAAGKRPIDYFVGKDVPALIADFESVDGLGALSRKYESNGDPGAVGEDRTGGPSYGAYQFASLRGSVASFITFLKSAKPEFAQKLNEAGGDAAARAKASAFVAAWKGLATDERAQFLQLQHANIKTMYYDPFLRTIKNQLDLDLLERSLALKNVAWSTAVQHGPSNTVFRNALKGVVLGTDEEIIKTIYAERSKVEKYFRSSTAAVQSAVKARFRNELADALEMLA